MSAQNQSIRQFLMDVCTIRLRLLVNIIRFIILHDLNTSCLFVCWFQSGAYYYSVYLWSVYWPDISTGTTPRSKSHGTWMPYLSKVQWVFRTHMFLWPHHRAWSDQSCCVSGKGRWVTTMTNHHWRTAVFAANGYPLTNKPGLKSS